MQRSTERILTTHTGSLPRPPDLIPVIRAKDAGEPVDSAALEEQIREAVQTIVNEQREAGVDIVNDGEASKAMYATYVKERLTGFGGEAELPQGRSARDLLEYPEWATRMQAGRGPNATRRVACDGPITYRGQADVERDIANLKAATKDSGASDVFMSAASPGVVAVFLENQYYPTHEAFVYAVADAMKAEYDAIAQAGIVLQIDCPDLAMGRHSRWMDESFEEFRKIAEINVAALNHALRDIPPEQLRMHICWGNYEGPHTHDVSLASMLDIILKARPSGISVEAANPRHAHEWAVFEDHKLPDGKVIIPGVLDSTCNFVEHPDLVAQRIVNYANVVGRENVIAGTDCGFSTGVGSSTVVPRIAWAKFNAMTEGARIASQKLW